MTVNLKEYCIMNIIVAAQSVKKTYSPGLIQLTPDSGRVWILGEEITRRERRTGIILKLSE